MVCAYVKYRTPNINYKTCTEAKNAELACKLYSVFPNVSRVIIVYYSARGEDTGTIRCEIFPET